MAVKKKEAKEKPLDKMTAKELRDVAKDIPEITGASGMNKEELLSAVKKAKGIEEKATGKDKSSVRNTKKKMKALKAEHGKALSADDKKMAAIYRKRLLRLKKKSRRAA
jgi:hypothetical protein